MTAVWIAHYAAQARETITNLTNAVSDARSDVDTEAYTIQREALMLYGGNADMVSLSDREGLTAAALSYSLCPVHFCDYAICFDDEPADCEQVRLIHPMHDT